MHVRRRLFQKHHVHKRRFSNNRLFSIFHMIIINTQNYIINIHFFNIKGAQTQQLPATWPEVNSSMNAAAAALYHQTPPCPKLDLLHLPPFAFHWTTVATAEMRAAESPATNKHEHWLQKKKNFKATRLQITGTSPHLPLARNQWTHWPVL